MKKIRITNKLISILKNNLTNNTNDNIYHILVCMLSGYYGIAFFGHKGTKYQKARLNNIWKRIIATD